MEVSFVINDATRLILRPETKVEEDVLNKFSEAEVKADVDQGKPILIITRSWN
jgi:hypothetical protein